MSSGLNSSNDELSFSSSNSSNNNYNGNLVNKNLSVLNNYNNNVLNKSDTTLSLSSSYAYQISPGFIRVKLIELDPAPNYYAPAPPPAPSTSSGRQQASCALMNLDPYCAVNIKEKIYLNTKTNTNSKTQQHQQPVATFNSQTNRASILFDDTSGGGGGGNGGGAGSNGASHREYKLVQKKPTFYPKWNTCFDCHLYKGRTIQIIILNSTTNEYLAEATVSAERLAAKARDRLTHQDWVCCCILLLLTTGAVKSMT